LVVISVEQQQKETAPFVLPLIFSFQDGVNTDLARALRVTMDQRRQEFTIPLAQKPVLIVLDPNNTLLMNAKRVE